MTVLLTSVSPALSLVLVLERNKANATRLDLRGNLEPAWKVSRGTRAQSWGPLAKVCQIRTPMPRSCDSRDNLGSQRAGPLSNLLGPWHEEAETAPTRCLQQRGVRTLLDLSCFPEMERGQSRKQREERGKRPSR